MAKISKKEAIDILLDNTPIEIIHRTTETPDFWEFMGECGGDALVYRIVDEDHIYAK